MKVYGVSVSYYTGKLEAYLRYKGIGYTMQSPFAEAEQIKPHTGAIQVPMVRRDDGRWMSDTTPILAQLDREHPEKPIFPDNPVVRFIALLMEDYADEWLWRPAMHYRWSFEHDRALLSRILVDELAGHVKAPRWLKLKRISNRQHTGFVIKDGVTDTTRAHVEAGYRAALDNMTRMLSERPFLLGNAPSIADFGFIGPMLRHFGQDPTPAEIMRDEGPAVFEWLGRVWNAGTRNDQPEFVAQISASAGPMLREICETHLNQLDANASAYAVGARRFDATIQGCGYRDLPVSRYRVYCLERLQEEFDALSPDERSEVRDLLPYEGAEILWRSEAPATSEYDVDREAPFNKAINVFGDGVPE